MARSAADAFGSVDDGVRQSATAVGYSSWQRFWQVELPLAGPVLLAGLRVVAVSTIALVTVGAIVGVQSLGYYFTDGYQRHIVFEVLTGLVLTMARRAADRRAAGAARPAGAAVGAHASSGSRRVPSIAPGGTATA